MPLDRLSTRRLGDEPAAEHDQQRQARIAPVGDPRESRRAELARPSVAASQARARSPSAGTARAARGRAARRARTAAATRPGRRAPCRTGAAARAGRRRRSGCARARWAGACGAFGAFGRDVRLGRFARLPGAGRDLARDAAGADRDLPRSAGLPADAAEAVVVERQPELGVVRSSCRRTGAGGGRQFDDGDPGDGDGEHASARGEQLQHAPAQRSGRADEAAERRCRARPDRRRASSC